MKILKLIVAFVILIISSSSAQQQNVNIPLVFSDHLSKGLIEQDVFVKKNSSDEVFRILPNEVEKHMDSELFLLQNPEKHDPFNAYNAGPFVAGKSMGITLDDWTKARGEGSYSCEEGWGNFSASFTGLMPDAVYTFWYVFIPKGVKDPFIGALELPLGERDGSQAAFTSDANGNADIKIAFDTCLELGNPQLKAAIALAYHSDGKTYGTSYGAFGTITHIQLLTMLPDEITVINEVK